ncbi:uncharacterized protein BP5553_03699 [Venustampulla echinocandica]|uniref:3'-5' exonuclease domain-containing protein n=1 Tax=Venustampulla echinocandica TaxID=2656787 RepID=A0A370TV29_9HELO|nr:uncharacterized protein BP5553_03699 [Venustampulla echinocandica]RDL39359.1 hypothetical protein BP5553_03699 [Venustampulla echinocandica]
MDRRASATDSTFIDTHAAMINLIDGLTNRPNISLYVDLEGVNLSRHSTISIMQMLVHPLNKIYLIDIHTLDRNAFYNPGRAGTTLKDILESKQILKVFFDVRNDSDALFGLYGIRLAGIQDIQLMEVASRKFLGSDTRKWLSGLKKCIENDSSLPSSYRETWRQIKESGRRLFVPESGGSFEIFNTRPLPDAIRLYYIQDVQFMPGLLEYYKSILSLAWTRRVEHEIEARLASTQPEGFNSCGPGKTLAPIGWLCIK